MMVTIFELLEVAFLNGIGLFFSQEFSKFVHSRIFKRLYKKLREVLKR